MRGRECWVRGRCRSGTFDLERLSRKPGHVANSHVQYECASTRGSRGRDRSVTNRDQGTESEEDPTDREEISSGRLVSSKFILMSG